jgi:hypothetical protein
MTIDKITRTALLKVVDDAMREKMEMYNEEWVSGKELSHRIAAFTSGWMKLYGRSLPRTQVVVRDENNVEHQTGWVYPLHKIQGMMQDGRIKELRV